MSAEEYSPSRGPGIASELLLFLLPAAMVVALLIRPIGLADLGWQLKVGELMVREGTPYLRERFAVQHLGEQLLPNAWLAQILFHQLMAAGGWTALRAMDVAIWLAGFLVVSIPARQRGASSLAVAAALMIAFVVALPAASIRPQSFASVAFGLTLTMMQRPNYRAAIFAVPLFILWQNLHPSVTIAVLVTGATAGIQWLLYAIDRGPAPTVMTMLCLAAVCAIFATPSGVSIISLAAYNATASLLAGASEWYPLWAPVNLRFVWPVAASAIVVAVIGFQQRCPLVEMMPIVLTLALSVFAARFILFYAIAIIPVLARLRLGKVVGVPRATMAAGSCALAMVPAILMPVRLVSEPPPAAVRLLSRVNGPIYSEPTYGGAIIHSIPNAQISFDGRFYLYREDEFRLLARTVGDRTTLAQIVASYHPRAFALARFRSSALIAELESRPREWAVVFADRDAVLFVRTSPFGRPT